jgi:hypothetical protein
MQSLPYWWIGSDQNWITLEIRAQLPESYQQRKSYFLELLIIYLITLQSPGNKVNGQLILALPLD